MSINFENADLEDIRAVYPGINIESIIDLVSMIDEYVNLGLADLDSVDSAEDVLKGIRDGLSVIDSLPEDLRNEAVNGLADSTRFALHAAEGAAATGRKVTLRSIGIVLATVGLAFVQERALAGEPEAIEAATLATELGLL